MNKRQRKKSRKKMIFLYYNRTPYKNRSFGLKEFEERGPIFYMQRSEYVSRNWKPKVKTWGL